MTPAAPLLIRNACLPDGRRGIDLLAEAGRIVAVGPSLPAPPGAQVVEAGGWMLSPPFVKRQTPISLTSVKVLQSAGASLMPW